MSKENAGVGVAFALAACGFLPLFLLPFTALRARLSALGNRSDPRFKLIGSDSLTLAIRLCLTASLFGLLNIVIHLAYGMIRSVMLLTALALAVSQIICYGAVVWLRSCQKARPMPKFCILTPRVRHDRPGQHLSRLVLSDRSSPNGRPSNLEEQHIGL